MKKLYEYFQKISLKNNLSHAYLIANTTFEGCKKELENVISDFLFCRKVDIENNLDIFIVEPIENNITKDQIKELLSWISTTSQISGLKAYVITNCENLSDSVYNTLLKTIEEPEENIYAFFITTNIESVVKTIKSRCHNIFVSSESINEANDELYELAYEFASKYEKEKLNIICDNNIYKNIGDRSKFKLFIKELYKIYMAILYNKINIEHVYKIDIKTNSTEKQLCMKLLVINYLIEKDKININKDILFDKLIIDLWRCDNENCVC